MTGTEARELAKRKSRYGRRDWVVWKGKDGEYCAEVASASSVKRALLAVGTQGAFVEYEANNGNAHLYGWRIGVRWLKNLKYAERAGGL